MIRRKQQAKLNRQLEHHPAVVLIGPRQVGKTTLALQVAEDRPSIYVDLERPTDLAKISDIEAFCDFNNGQLIILDEIQRAPGIFAPLRSVIDVRRREGRRFGQFLLLGSASLDLLKQSSESLAGRLSIMELQGLAVDEVQAAHDAMLWIRGGFPESFLAVDDHASFEWRLNFIRTYLERDVPLLGPRIPAETLDRFWKMIANAQGQLHNAATFANALDVAGSTIARYVDLLVDLLLVRRLQPWSANIGKRLVKSPKLYVRDTGICHALLGINDLNALLGHPVSGASWEGFVIENISSNLPKLARPYFYRTSAGAELDLLLDFPGTERWAIDIKLSRTPSVGKGFHIACDDVEATRRIVIHGGSESYPMPHGVEAMSLRAVMAELAAL